MAAAKKFLFDLSFDAPTPEQPAAKAEPKVGVAELEAARAEAFAQGREAGLAEAALLREAQLAAATDAAAAALKVIGRAHDVKLAEIEREAAGLAAAVLARVAPSLARRTALDDIAALVAQCLGEAADEPRVVLRVADDHFEALKARVAPLAESAGFAGKLVILGDEALGPADARVEWADGGAERDLGRLTREIETAALRLLDAPPSSTPGSPGETP
jgi:flagellar assembly protein FliH